MNKYKHMNAALLQRKTIALFLYLCSAVSLTAQQSTDKNFNKSFSFRTDNDAYLFIYNDAYYTNGFFLNYSFAQSKNDLKQIHAVELSQKIYTPLSRNVRKPSDIDRAYCGYLNLNYTKTAFLKKEALVQYSGSLGIVGPASWGQGMQETYHTLLRYAQFYGWEYQIGNSLSVDAGLTYAKTIAENKWAKLIPVGQVNIGTAFTNAKLGAMLVAGAFEKNSASVLWNARIADKQSGNKKEYELFAYWYPQIIAQGYNATIQGGLLSSSPKAVTQSLAPVMLQSAIGVCFAEKRTSCKLEYVFQSKETPSQIKDQRYIGFQLAYLFN
jgi:hypothetical protein